MWMTAIYVALGGGIGATLRFLTGVYVGRWANGTFPLGVLCANVIGCFLMGLVVVYLGQKSMNAWQPFLMTGILGGYTTFSAFSLEAFTLIENGLIGQGVLYILLSVFVSIAALILGIMIARGIWA